MALGFGSCSSLGSCAGDNAGGGNAECSSTLPRGNCRHHPAPLLIAFASFTVFANPQHLTFRPINWDTSLQSRITLVDFRFVSVVPKIVPVKGGSAKLSDKRVWSGALSLRRKFALFVPSGQPGGSLVEGVLKRGSGFKLKKGTCARVRLRLRDFDCSSDRMAAIRSQFGGRRMTFLD